MNNQAVWYDVHSEIARLARYPICVLMRALGPSRGLVLFILNQVMLAAYNGGGQ